MKAYLLDIIPKIKKYGEKLDDSSFLTEKNWVLIDDGVDKIIYIFRLKNNQLIISTNGHVEKANWEYLNSNSLLISQGNSSRLYKHGFIDDTILALKLEDNTDKYHLFVNEKKFDEYLKTLVQAQEYLEKIQDDVIVTESPEEPKNITKTPPEPIISDFDDSPIKPTSIGVIFFIVLIIILRLSMCQ